MENTTLPDALKGAGLRMSTKKHPGKGRGPIKVRRPDVEKFFLDHRDEYYRATAVASAIDKPAKSVSTHLYRMEVAGLLLLQEKGKDPRYRAYKTAPGFRKLTVMHTRRLSGERPPKEVAAFAERTTSPPPWETGRPTWTDENLSIGEHIEGINLTIALLDDKMAALGRAYAQIKHKVGAIL